MVSTTTEDAWSRSIIQLCRYNAEQIGKSKTKLSWGALKTNKDPKTENTVLKQTCWVSSQTKQRNRLAYIAERRVMAGITIIVIK